MSALGCHSESLYKDLCHGCSVGALSTRVVLSDLHQGGNFLSGKLDQRFAMELFVLTEFLLSDNSAVELLDDQSVKVDSSLLDQYVFKIDSVLSEQMDCILHHDMFKQCESAWRGLHYLIKQVPGKSNVRLELMDVDKTTLAAHFDESDSIESSSVYQSIYTEAYDTPGGDPFSAIIGAYEFNSSVQDIALLDQISRVSWAAHCPFISSVSPTFFHKNSMHELQDIQDIAQYMQRAEYIKWQSFRSSEQSRYVGLTLPKFLLRLPHESLSRNALFHYAETIDPSSDGSYLWGNASFCMAANIVKSFVRYGWSVNIRGPQSGGRVGDLLLHQYNAGFGLETKMPVEMVTPEGRELELAEAGFIPLSYYMGTDYACFFSANAVQQPDEFDDPALTANSRINARLPYIFLTSRLAHYLKVLQRETIGTQKPAEEIERELNGWLKSLVTEMNHPSMDMIARHPLRAGDVKVRPIEDNPGFYQVDLSVVPHFQVEGMNVQLMLVSKLPRKDKRLS